jgi:large subunit ribosomal protein L18
MTVGIQKFRRRLEGKTDYKKRLDMLRSGKPRFVVRVTNTRIITHITAHDFNGDKTIVTANSDELKKHGWALAHKNLPAAYLTGMLCAKKAKAAGVKEAILDMGLRTPLAGTRVFGALKGAIDGGLNIPADPESFPPADRLAGKHMKEDAAKTFEKVKASLAK